MTGSPQAVRELVAGRSGGLCEIRHPASCTGRVEQLHHRTPRGMGGSRHPAINNAANCLGVCAECHAFVESSREVAMWHGWLVSRCDVSATRPVLYQSRWVLLDAAGNVTEVATASPAVLATLAHAAPQEAAPEPASDQLPDDVFDAMVPDDDVQGDLLDVETVAE